LNFEISKIFENDNEDAEVNLFESPKKKSIDFDNLYNDDPDLETSNIFDATMNEREEIKIIGKMDKNSSCIEKIQEELDISFENDANDSLINENQFFINNDNIINDNFTNSSEQLNDQFSSSIISSPFTGNLNWNFNNTINLANYSNNSNNNILSGQNRSGHRKKLNNLTITNTINQSGSNFDELNIKKNYSNLNISTSLFSGDKKENRGRKKFFPDGAKREVIEKAFLRQFKIFLKKSKTLFTIIYNDLDNEEKSFWNEFIYNNNPPFCFSIDSKKVEFKSFSSSLMKFIFSHQSVKVLYDEFIKEKFLIKHLINKKIKVCDEKVKNFYYMYGTNMHKIYSVDNCSGSLNCLDLVGDNTTTNNTNTNINLGNLGNIGNIGNILEYDTCNNLSNNLID